jgi:uncharacterized protein (TIGR00661 family)
MGSYLESQGHEIRMVSYDRGYKNLHERFDVFETIGLHIANRDNKVSVPRTVSENLGKSPKMLGKAAALRRELFIKFRPDAVISDFEPQTAYLAWACGVPLISLDNQHRIRYMEYPCPPGMDRDRRMTELVIRLMVPRPNVSLATTFYFGKTKNDHTFLFPPILREDVRAITPETGDHIHVYLSFGFDSFVDLLREETGELFVLYGYNRDDVEGHITYRKFSRDGFLRDMATSKGVIATAGFTTLTEGLYYRKPYMTLPMTGQFEQQLNGYLLQELGYGVNAPQPDADRLRFFLNSLSDYQGNLESYRAEDNAKIEAKLDELLADDCAELKRFAAG